MLNEFLSDVRSLYELIIHKEEVFTDDFKKKWNVKASIGDIYQRLCKKEYKKEIGSVYTPDEVIEFMVNKLIQNIDKGKMNFTILDPSCGGGYFLINILKSLRIIFDGKDIEDVDKYIVDNILYGFDTDINAVMITVLEIYDKTGMVSKNIKLRDFLLDNEEQFDYIIGNPPYMGHKMIKKDYRNKLSEIYGDVFYDKGDISYCFIKKSIDSLNENGVLLFFTSRYILEALNGEGIRNFVLRCGQIKSIVDFYGVRVIKGVGIDNIVLTFKKQCINENIDFFRMTPRAKLMGKGVFVDINNKSELYTKYINIDRRKLQKSIWRFLDDTEMNILNKIKGLPMSTFCSSYQGIITGCDNAFVIDKETADIREIENITLKRWIKNKNVEKFNITLSNELLIYSDIIDNEVNFNNAIEYISKYRDRLEKRRECIKGIRKWYQLQWGRNMSIFEDKKIVYPYKASSNRFAIDVGSYFSADVYAMKIIEMFKDSISYEYLVGVLNSSIYEFYIKTMAKKLGDELYEYYPNKVMTLLIPEYISDIENEVIKNGHNSIENIDHILMELFGISDYEYKVIRKWCEK